ncbi:MAG: tetratricopeptide repeat protein [Puniceicoccaceae bacterium]
MNAPSKEPRPGLPTWKKVLFGVSAGLGLPLLALGVLELGLRFTGYGYESDLLVVSEDGDWLETNPRFCWQFFDPAMSRDPLSMKIARAKPEGVKRVVVLGGSAAQGYPESAYGFHRQLEVMLDETDGESDWEVINLAITAINSHVVRSIAGEVHKLDPDAVLIYMGNNEVVGPYGPGTAFADFQTNLQWIRFSLRLKQLKMVQMLEHLASAWKAGGNREAWGGMAMMAENLVPHDDPRLQRTYDHFARNLEAILGQLEPLDSPVILATVPVNLRDCSPFAIVTEEEPGLVSTIRDRVEAAEECQLQGNPESARQLLEAALELSPTDAELHFRTGRILESTGEMEAARAAYGQARNFDALRFRADSRINAIIRETGSRFDHLTSLVDLEAGFGMAGRELFFEHVHLTFEGNHRVAKAFFEELQEAGLIDSLHHPSDMEACARSLVFDDFARSLQLQRVDSIIRRPPFTRQYDFLQTLQSLQNKRSALSPKLTGEAYGESIERHRKALQKRPQDAALRIRLAYLLMESGKPDEAIPEFETCAQLNGHDFETAADQALARFKAGDEQGALQELLSIRETFPLKPKPLVNLLQALRSTGQIDEACRQVSEAGLPIPSDRSVAIERIKLLLAMGKKQEALNGLLNLLKTNPYDFTTRIILLEHISPESLEAARLIRLDVAFLKLAARPRETARSLLAFYGDMARSDLRDQLIEAITQPSCGPELHLAATESLIADNRSDRAIPLLENALATNHLSLADRNNLAWLLATTETTEEERLRALSLSEAILAAYPCPPASVHGTHGASLAANARHEEASTAINTAIRINAKTGQFNPEVLETLLNSITPETPHD